MRFILFFLIFTLSACTSTGNHQPAWNKESPGLGAQHSTQMTAQESLDVDGMVIGDIGNGQVYRSDYRCENGDMSLSLIVPNEGEPIVTEGSVCCGG